MQEEMQGFVWRGAGFSLPAQVPGCVSDALCAAGIIPPPDVGLNALRGEWAAAREWTLCGRIALPQGRERVFLRARGVHGAGVLLAAGREVGRFAQGDWETEITEFIGAEADSVQIGLRFFARPAEGVPRRALVGVRGGLDAFGVNRLRFEDCYACAAVRDGVSTAEFRMTVRPFVPGRYTFRFAAVYGGETLACCEFAEDLRAVRTEIRKTLAVPSPRIWHAAEKNEPVWLRATVLSAGLVCDDHLARTGFRTAEANADARLSVNGERILLRGARWRCGEPVAWARQKRRLEALRACGLNCLQTEGLAGDALLSWLDAHGMLCVCVLPGDETAAAQIVRRAREHPCVVAYCGQSAAVCRALDGDRPFLGALFAPIGCAAVHGNLAALRGDAEDAPFRAEREAARYADEGTQGGKDAACVENENRDGGFSQATETLPCFDVLSSGAETESFSAPISRYMQTEAPNEYVQGKDGVNETVHFAAGEMCGGFDAGSGDEHPTAAPTSRFTPSGTSNEYIEDARMYEKVAENETVHFAAGETSGGIGAGKSDAHPIAAPTSRFTPSGTSNEYIEDARMYEKVAENETVHFAAGETSGGVGAGSGDESPATAPTSRFTPSGTSYEYIEDARMCMYEKVAGNETAHFAASKTCSGFDEVSSDEHPIAAPTSRFTPSGTSYEYIEDARMYEKVAENENAHFAAGEMCGGVGAGRGDEHPIAASTLRFTSSGTSNEYIEDARMCIYEKVAENETVHFSTDEMCGGVGAGSNDEHPIAAPTSRFTLAGTSYEYIGDARMCIYEKVAENETVHFAVGETSGGIGAGSSDEHPIAAPISRFTPSGTSNEYIEDARMYEKVAENEISHFTANKTCSGFGEMSGGVQPLAMPVSRFEQTEPLCEHAENQSRKNAFSQATETLPRFGIQNNETAPPPPSDTPIHEKIPHSEEAFPLSAETLRRFGIPNSGTETAPLSLPTSRFTVPAPPPPSDTPIREKTPHSQETFPLPAETLRRFGIPNSGAETVPLSPQTLPFTPSDPPSPPPDDMPMHEKPPHSQETFPLSAETRRRFGILSSEAEALAAPISRYVQAETLRERVEDARMRGENILLAEPFETVESPRSAALFDGERPRPAFFAVESALRPAHVCARMERTGYPCGAPMEAEIWLLYDAKTVPGPLRVSTALCDSTGREIARAVFDASPRTGVVGRFRAKMPDVPGALILRVQLDALGEMLDVSDTIVCAALNAPMWPLAHAPYAAVRIENGEIRNACARAAYGVACGGYLNAAWPGWGALLTGECRAVRDETHAEALNMEPKMK